jgi:phospholipid/cholesterol/gamma-HCH transport system substrate-binding protein
MSAKAHYFRVGLFVLIGIVLIVAGVIVFGAGTLFRREVIIETYIEESVQGLDVGAPVKYRGVQIGQVKEIGLVSRLYLAGKTDAVALVQGRDVVVRMGIFQLPRLGKSPTGAEVRQLVNDLAGDGFRVRLASQGITGVAYMEMDFVSNPPPPIRLTWEPEYPYLPSAPSTTTRFVQSAEEVLDKLSRVDIDGLISDARTLIQNVDKTVKEADIPGLRREASGMIRNADGLVTDARGAVKDLQVAAIREQIVGFVSDLRKTNQDLQGILAKVQIEPIMTEIQSAVTKVNSVIGRIDQQLSGNEIKDALRNMADASAEIASASKDLGETVQLLHRKLNRVDAAAINDDIQAILDNLRRISQGLETITNNAKQYPSQVLFGEPPPHTSVGGKP